MKAKKFTFASLIPIGSCIFYSIFSNLIFIPVFLLDGSGSDFGFFLFLVAAANIVTYIPFFAIASNIVAIVFQAKALKRKEILWLNILLLALSIILIILAIAYFIIIRQII